MAKLHKTVRKFSPGRAVFGKKLYDTFHPIGTSIVEAAEPVPEAPAVPMPDEEDLRRARRRSTRAQLSRSGRASTILSDSDRLGP